MNTYNESLQTTVNNTLAELAAENTKLKAVQTAKAYDLYNAQGVEITAFDHLADSKKALAAGRAINHQSLLNENQVNNLSLFATDAATDAGVSNTNMAIAASNIQIASTAIEELAGQIGFALNSASASLYDSHVYHHIQVANNYINEVANEARGTSLLAMTASAQTSEIIAAALAVETGGVKAKIDNLLKVSQAEVDKFSTQLTADQAAGVLASQAGQLAWGAVADIDGQIEANHHAYRNASRDLNLGLKVTGTDGVKLTFNALPARLPTFRSDLVKAVPVADPKYYLTLVPEEQQATFTPDQAQRAFMEDPTTSFEQFLPGTEMPVKLGHDANGDAVKAGHSYVAYLYIRLSPEYQQFVNNFADQLSSPSLPFVPATTLPLAHQAPAQSGHAGDVKPLVSIWFRAAGMKPDLTGLEFRCILVEQSPHAEDGLMRKVHFNLDIAQLVAPSNYTALPAAGKARQTAAAAGTAEDASAAADAAPPPADVADSAATAEQLFYVVDLDGTATDNFGSKLRPGGSYKPYILTVVNSDANENANDYVSVLSRELDVVTIPAESATPVSDAGK